MMLEARQQELCDFELKDVYEEANMETATYGLVITTPCRYTNLQIYGDASKGHADSAFDIQCAFKNPF